MSSLKFPFNERENFFFDEFAKTFVDNFGCFIVVGNSFGGYRFQVLSEQIVKQDNTNSNEGNITLSKIVETKINQKFEDNLSFSSQSSEISIFGGDSIENWSTSLTNCEGLEIVHEKIVWISEIFEDIEIKTCLEKEIVRRLSKEKKLCPPYCNRKFSKR